MSARSLAPAEPRGCRWVAGGGRVDEIVRLHGLTGEPARGPRLVRNQPGIAQ